MALFDPTPSATALPGALRDIADRLMRLPAYSHRRPEAFHEGKDELAHELLALADGATGRPAAQDPRLAGRADQPRREHRR